MNEYKYFLYMLLHLIIEAETRSFSYLMSLIRTCNSSRILFHSTHLLSKIYELIVLI